MRILEHCLWNEWIVPWTDLRCGPFCAALSVRSGIPVGEHLPRNGHAFPQRGSLCEEGERPQPSVAAAYMAIGERAVPDLPLAARNGVYPDRVSTGCLKEK